MDLKTFLLNTEIEGFLVDYIPPEDYDGYWGARELLKRELDYLLNNSAGEIELNDLHVGDVGATLVANLLKNNTECTELRLQGNNISDIGASAIADSLLHNNTLTKLHLANNSISDIGASAIADSLHHNNTLRSLFLATNIISGIGASAFADSLHHSNTLIHLDLEKNIISGIGASAIADSLDHNNTLIHLNLGNNKLGFFAAKSFGEALKHNTTLEILVLHGNDLGVAGVLYLANACKCYNRYIILTAFPKADISWEGTCFGGDVKLLTLLGEGNFGSAHVGETDYFEGKCVVKTAKDPKSVEAMYEYLLLLCLPEHDNVLKLYGQSSKDIIIDEKKECQTLLLVHQHEGGSLKSYTKKHQATMTLSQRLSFARQMTLAVQHLHKYHMVHRDIALRNFVLSKDRETVVIIDFGLSFILEENQQAFLARPKEPLPFRSLPPESLFSPQPFYKTSDVWMLGVAFWEMCNILGGVPFKNMKLADIKDRILKEMVKNLKPIPLPFPKGFIHPQIDDLVKFCCEFDHRRRPTATQVLEKISEIVDEVEWKDSDDQPEDDPSDQATDDITSEEDVEYMDYTAYIHIEPEDDYIPFNVESGEKFDDILEKYTARCGNVEKD